MTSVVASRTLLHRVRNQCVGSARRRGRGENCIQTFTKKTQRSEGNDVLKWIKEK